MSPPKKRKTWLDCEVELSFLARDLERSQLLALLVRAWEARKLPPPGDRDWWIVLPSGGRGRL